MPGNYAGAGFCNITTEWISLVAYPVQDNTPHGTVNISCNDVSRHINVLPGNFTPEDKHFSQFIGISFLDGNSNNDTDNYGSGGCLLLSGLAYVKDCDFKYCKASLGGAISAYFNNDTLVIVNSSFVENTALIGGAVYTHPGTLIDYSSFENNVGYNGGAVYYTGGDIYNCSFIGNTANLYGGAVLVNVSGIGDPVGVIEGNYIENNSGQSGGGIYIMESKTNVLILDSKFISNHVTDNGGGICFQQLSSVMFDVTLQGCTFTSNSAGNGAGLYINANQLSNFRLWHTNVISSNIATKNESDAAGGIYLYAFQGTDKGISLGNMNLTDNMPTDYYCDSSEIYTCQKPECTYLSCDQCLGLCTSTPTKNNTQCYSDNPFSPCVHGVCIKNINVNAKDL
jgi:hypothetical protein